MAKETQQHKNQVRAIKDANAEIARFTRQDFRTNWWKRLTGTYGDNWHGLSFSRRCPHASRLLEAYCNQAATCCADIPSDRWDIDEHYDPVVTVPGKIYVRQGYYLDKHRPI